MTETDTNTTRGTDTYVDIQVDREGVHATLYEEEVSVVGCPDCDEDGCEACEQTGKRHVADPVVCEEWWQSWAELIEDGKRDAWVAFSGHVQDAIKTTDVQLELDI